jgi:NADH-quinone oxidoreductase subunit J
MDHLFLAATIPDSLTFAIAAAISVVGALGVVISRNPVHSALMLILTLFGVAVLFVEEDAQFLAAVQVIVYAGAIVVLFLFVIMLLGVDRQEAFGAEPMPAQRWLALGLGVAALAEVVLLAKGHWPTGAHSVAGKARTGQSNTYVLGHSLFTTYLLPFEITSALLVIAVIGAAVLARRPRRTEAGPGEQIPPEPAYGAGNFGAGPAAQAIEAEQAGPELEKGEPVGEVLEDQEGVSVVGRPEP